VQISQIKNNSCIFLINNKNFSSGLINDLNSFVEDGGTLAIFPNKLADYSELNSLLTKLSSSTIASFDTAKASISKISYDHNLYKEVFKKHEDEADLPSVEGYTILNEQTRNQGTEVMTFRNGKSALTSNFSGKGTVYLFAFPLNKANFNFIRHIIFLPTVYNMVLQSGLQQKYSYSIDSDEPVLLNSNSPISELKTISQQTKEEFITSIRTVGKGKQQLILDELPKNAGHYLISEGNQAIQSISYNYSRLESDSKFYDDSELQKLMQSSNFKQFQLIKTSDSALSETLQDYSNGKQLWKYCIIIAILFMMCEVAIIRFWK
jgi:hypothetical protein